MNYNVTHENQAHLAELHRRANEHRHNRVHKPEKARGWRILFHSNQSSQGHRMRYLPTFTQL